MNTVSVKKTSNIQVAEIQIKLQDGHQLVNYNKIHEKLQAFVSSDNQGCIVLWNLSLVPRLSARGGAKQGERAWYPLHCG